MMEKKINRGLAIFHCIIFLTLACSVASADTPSLPRSMVWSSYDINTSGYSEASAIASALQENFETRIRVVPSGTSIGHVLPLQQKKAILGFFSTETYFAAEGLHDFAAPRWGPQDLRIVLARPAAVGLAVAADVGVKSASDLRGKRVGYVKGNASNNMKVDAYLAFGGLTRADVQPVWFGSYGAQKDGILANQVDAMNMAPNSSIAREIEASPRGLAWVSFDPDDNNGWRAIHRTIDFAQPRKLESGVAVSSENPVWLLGYRYPVIATYADTSEEDIYQIVKAIDESFPDFKDATSDTDGWSIENAIVPPADAPWHAGTIRYAKEKGYWTQEAQQWQDARMARLEHVQQGWKTARKTFEDQQRDPEIWPAFWQNYRAEYLVEKTLDDAAQ